MGDEGDWRTPIRLGELIDTLACIEPSIPVVFDGGESVGPFDSWRGCYDHLSLEPGGGGPYWKCETVSDLYRHAAAVDGATREGYKGGTFEMNRRTFVWADPWGDSYGRAVMGCKISEGRLVLVTGMLDVHAAISETVTGSEGEGEHVEDGGKPSESGGA